MNVYIVPTPAILRGFDKCCLKLETGPRGGDSRKLLSASASQHPGTWRGARGHAAGIRGSVGAGGPCWFPSQGLGKAPGWLLRASESEWKSRHEHSNFVAGKDLGAGFSKL